MSKEETVEELFFLGAGASVAAGVPDTFGMVEAFKQTLEATERSTLEDILRVLKDWRTSHEDVEQRVDVELLLETMERLSHPEQEVLVKFLRLPESKALGSEEVGILSVKLKDFIRKNGEVASEKVGYLQPLLGFKNAGKPLDIFSVNYDIGIEQLCNVNKKRYVDGFDFEWNGKNFQRTDVDIRLFKLHGSIMWYRTDTGSYVKIPISSIKATTELITGETAETLILYPMRKWEYEEPLQELLMELKTRLEKADKVIVVGYSFRDEHIRRVFWDAARRNRQFTLVLIGPHCREIYLKQLKHYSKPRLISVTSPEQTAVSLPVDSELAGRTICLPFEFEKVLPFLKNWFFQSMRLGFAVERNRLTQQGEGSDVSEIWVSELKYFLDCIHVDKVDEIDSQIYLSALMSERPSDAFGIYLRGLIAYAAYGDLVKCKEWLLLLETMLLTVYPKVHYGDKALEVIFGFLTPNFKWISVAEVLKQNQDVLRRLNQIKLIILEDRLQAAKPMFDSIGKMELELTMLAGVKDRYSYGPLRRKSHKNEIRRFDRAVSRFASTRSLVDSSKAEGIAQRIEQSEFSNLIRSAGV